MYQLTVTKAALPTVAKESQERLPAAISDLDRTIN